MDNKLRKELRAKANGLDVTVQIGKAGLTDATLLELEGQLKNRKLVKVRMLLSSTEGGVEQDAVVAKILESVKGELVEQKGHTLVLYRR